jgi:hypothetical protein
MRIKTLGTKNAPLLNTHPAAKNPHFAPKLGGKTQLARKRIKFPLSASARSVRAQGEQLSPRRRANKVSQLTRKHRVYACVCLFCDYKRARAMIKRSRERRVSKVAAPHIIRQINTSFIQVCFARVNYTALSRKC